MFSELQAVTAQPIFRAKQLSLCLTIGPWAKIQNSEADVEDNEAYLQDPLTEVARDRAQKDDYGEDCEFHIYESRHDTRGEQVLLRVGTKNTISLEEDRSRRACLVLTRYYARGSANANKPYSTSLKIQSKHIRKALKDVIGSYPGENFHEATVYIKEPLTCLFHYSEELRQYALEADDTKVQDHVFLCLRYMEKTMQEEFKLFDESLKDPFNLQLDQDHLWIIFKPGCLVYERREGLDIVFKLQKIVADVDHIEGFLGWDLWVEQIHYNGEEFGHISTWKWIPKFEGRKAVMHLDFFPLHLHPDAHHIMKSVEQRGRKYLSYCGVHHCLYNGLAKFEFNLVKTHVSSFT